MSHRSRTALALAAALVPLAAPAAALAVDDADLLASDPSPQATVFAADGSVVQGSTHVGNRAFVDGLLAQGATAGVLREDTSRYALPTEVRTGFARPATRLAPLAGRSTAARSRVAVRVTTQADGRRTMERGFAADIATGQVRRVSLEDARRLSADPRGGTPGTMYVWSLERDLPAAGGR